MTKEYKSVTALICIIIYIELENNEKSNGISLTSMSMSRAVDKCPYSFTAITKTKSVHFFMIHPVVTFGAISEYCCRGYFCVER